MRLCVFVGGPMTAQSPCNGSAVEAATLRVALRWPDIALLADVHDRTAVPISGESQAFAADWALKSGADGLIITGNSLSDTLTLIGTPRGKGMRRPILIGDGVTEANLADAMAAADGVIVRSVLMRRDAGTEDLLRWDVDLCRRFVDAVQVPA